MLTKVIPIRWRLAMGCAVIAVIAIAVFFTGANETAARPNPQSATPIDTGANTAHLEPDLWALLQQHANGTSVPATITVALRHAPPEDSPDAPGQMTPTSTPDALDDYMTSISATHVEGTTWTLATTKTLAVIQRSDVYGAELVTATKSDDTAWKPTDSSYEDHARLDDLLNDIAEANHNGIGVSQAGLMALYANADGVLLKVKTGSETQIDAVRRWLSARDVYVLQATDAWVSNEIILLLPVEQVVPLVNAFGTAKLSATPLTDKPGLPMTRSRWTQDARDWEDRIIARFERVAARQTLSTMPALPANWKSDLSTKLRFHGVHKWRNLSTNEGITGAGIKVGIIDWAFGRFDAPNLPALSKTSVFNNSGSSINAFCQSLRETYHPGADVAFFGSPPCEPTVAFIDPIDHGSNVAELVRDIAPNATLYMAQANSPRQLSEAARWLKEKKEVDVIVHAGGWPYDGKGDGTSPLTTGNSPAAPADFKPDSPYIFYPSPLNTVDTTTSGTGPVWINAAGNQELWTTYVKNPTVIADGSYRNWVNFRSGESDDKDKICQPLPRGIAGNSYYYHLRWADSWPTGAHNLHFGIRRIKPLAFDDYLTKTWGGTYDQLGNYPVRRAAANVIDPSDLCLYVWIDPTASEKPEWLQFQVFLARENTTTFPDTWYGDTTSGHSIANPAESNTPGLVAVGARKMTEIAKGLTSYSGRGPVFKKGQDTTSSAAQTHIKPDVVAGSYAITYNKFVHDCDAIQCSKMYFSGTSGATSHMGGLAALLMEWYDELEYNPTSAEVGAALRSMAVDRGVVGPDNDWGHGHLELPCLPNEAVLSSNSFTEESRWSTDDCRSEQADTLSRHARYYTFYIPATSNVTIDLASEDAEVKMYLYSGPHGRGEKVPAGTGDVITDDEIEISLSRGVYTVEATTESGLATAEYEMSIERAASGARTSLWGWSSIDTSSPSTFTIRARGLESNQQYTALLSSSSSRFGFDQNCLQRTSRDLPASVATSRDLNFRVYVCSGSSSNQRSHVTTADTGQISVQLRRGGTNGPVVHTAARSVSVETPQLSPPLAPSGVSAGSASRTSINVSWSVVSNAAKYRVQYRRGSSGTWSTATSSATGASYRVRSLSCGNTYQFQVAAYGDGNNYAAVWGPYSSPPSSVSTNNCQLNPIFFPSSFSFGVPEDARSGHVVGTLNARDPDGSDGLMRYSITGGNSDGRFAINSVTGVVTLTENVTSSTPISFQLSVRVRDAQGLTDTATVRIRVLKVIPMFSAMDYELHVLEGASVGQEVGTVVAMDPDAADNLLRYSITGGNSAGKFALDSVTGVITLAQTIGAAEPTSYPLTVQVTDLDNRTDTATVVVLVVTPVEVLLRERFLTGAEGAEDNTVRIEVLSWDLPGRNLVFPLVVEHQWGASAADYSGIPEALLIPADEHYTFFDITITDDTVRDAGERIKVSFGDIPVGVSFDHEFDKSTVVTIRDNDGHSDTVIWSTTLTVGDHGGYLGFSDPSLGQPGGGDPAGTLSSNQFTWNGTTYRVTDLLNNPYRHSGYLGLDLSSPLTTGDYENLTLRFDGMALKVSDRDVPPSVSESRQWWWYFVAAEWSVGDQVLVELTHRRP